MNRSALAGLVGLALVGCAAPAGEPGGVGSAAAPSATSASTVASGAVRLAVVGDSLSAGLAGPFTQDGIGPGSYVYWAARDGVELVGGTAVPGATSVEQRDRAAAVDADVLVMALGTNDLSVGLPWSRTATALREIVAVVAAERVLLLTVPPAYPEFRPTTVAFNASLADLAAAEGWTLVDAPAAVRDGDGWAEGMTVDGIHYTDEAARLVGDAVHDAVVAAVAEGP